MKHIVQIQKEFVKKAAEWDDLSYDAQIEYLRKHRKSKRHLTAFPGEPGAKLEKFDEQMAKWNELSYDAQKDFIDKHPKSLRQITKELGESGSGIEELPEFKKALEERQFIDVDTNQRVSFDKLTNEDQKKKIIDSLHSVIDKDIVERAGKRDKMREKRIKKGRNFTDRQVGQLGRLVAKDLDNDDNLDDDTVLETAKSMVESEPGLKKYFQEKGVEEKNMAAAFADYITLEKPEKGEKSKDPKRGVRFLDKLKNKANNRESFVYSKVRSDERGEKKVNKLNKIFKDTGISAKVQSEGITIYGFKPEAVEKLKTKLNLI